jgi:hypothetical protein
MTARKYDDLTVPRDNLAAIEVVEFLNRVAVRAQRPPRGRALPFKG